MTRAAVTVVMPAWNAARFIEEALRSILEQTVAPTVVIVVDDGSSDATAALASKLHPSVRVIAREHNGIGPARTAGVEAATTDLVAFLDADDIWLPQKLERQLALIADDP